jgi:hypothetical protein
VATPAGVSRNVKQTVDQGSMLAMTCLTRV